MWYKYIGYNLGNPNPGLRVKIRLGAMSETDTKKKEKKTHTLIFVNSIASSLRSESSKIKVMIKYLPDIHIT